MAQELLQYLNKIADIEDKIDEEIELLLESIDIDILLQNPQNYMEELSKQFFESLNDEMLLAIEAGEEKAERILKKIESKVNKE